MGARSGELCRSDSTITLVPSAMAASTFWHTSARASARARPGWAARAGAARVVAGRDRRDPAGAPLPGLTGLTAGAALNLLATGAAAGRLGAGLGILLRAGSRPLRGVAGPGARVGLAVVPAVVPGLLVVLAAVALTGVGLALVVVIVVVAAVVLLKGCGWP